MRLLGLSDGGGSPVSELNTRARVRCGLVYPNHLYFGKEISQFLPLAWDVADLQKMDQAVERLSSSLSPFEQFSHMNPA